MSLPSNSLCYEVPHKLCTVLLENISPYFVLNKLLKSVNFLGYTCQQKPSFFFPSTYVLPHALISKDDVLHYCVF
jgi:hypothetical protein